MRRLKVNPDASTLELSGQELGLLADLLGQTLGYQDARPGELTDEYRAPYHSLYKAFTGALIAMSDEEERRGAPFQAGERVELIAHYAPPNLERSGVVVGSFAEDDRHDYGWCCVRLDGGREVELAEFTLRREAPAGV